MGKSFFLVVTEKKSEHTPLHIPPETESQPKQSLIDSEIIELGNGNVFLL